MKPRIAIDRFFTKLVAEGILSVSTSGEVINRKTGRRIGTASQGYWKVFARNAKGESVGIAVHRLVWLVHKGPIPRNIVVNHKNGNKLDCGLDNLELETFSGNTRHAYSTGLAKARKGIENKAAKLTLDQVARIKEKKHMVSSYILAKEFGVGPTTIQKIWRGVSYKVQEQLTIITQNVDMQA